MTVDARKHRADRRRTQTDHNRSALVNASARLSIELSRRGVAKRNVDEICPRESLRRAVGAAAAADRHGLVCTPWARAGDYCHMLLGVTENAAVAAMFTIWLGVAVGVATPGPVHA